MPSSPAEASVPLVVDRRAWYQIRYATQRVLDSHHFHEVRGGRTVNAILLALIALNVLALILDE